MSHYLSYEQMIKICDKINEKYIPDGESFFVKVEELFQIEEPVTFQQFMVMTLKGLLSVVDEEIEKIEQKATIKPSCLKGCAHCCYFPIIVTQAEGKMLVDYIETLPEKAREDMKAHLKDYFSTYEAKIKDVCSMPFEGDFKKTYIRKQLPCPFLDTNSNTCKAYEVRPIPCRTYLNYCDPIVCAENDVPKEPFSYEFFYAFYMQALNEVIQELVEEEEFPFHYPQDLVTYDYLPNLLKKYLHEIR
ncbi:YkgJ family cysteine cluster protein [Bacillus sp. FJAT-47783]|uniref:YkgJ family cysteine cluster protein n=1 Tax=Bacillus sp. FJAT-47783 TaxID=2922712 RepID=UPI001FACCE39|nr:YkgJ family cysteine cluster protein [Bacillus sp. FJAT-47783]